MCGRREKNLRRKSQRTRQSRLRADSWRYVMKQTVNRKSLADLRCLKRKDDEEIYRGARTSASFPTSIGKTETPFYPLMRLADVPKTR